MSKTYTCGNVHARIPVGGGGGGANTFIYQSQSRTLWPAWLFCDGAAPVERPARQSASSFELFKSNLIKDTTF